MNKKFKRALSSILAFILVISTLTVMNVSSVFAADTTAYGSVTTSTDLTTKTWDFTTNMPSSNVTINTIGDSALGIVCSAGKIVLSSSKYLSVNKNSSFDIPVPENSAGSITIVDTANTKTDRYFMVEGDDSSQYGINKTTGVTIPFTSSITDDSYVTLSVYGGETKSGTIKVVLTSGTFPEDTSVTYTITGSAGVANTAITVGTYEATTDANGNYKIEKSVEEGEDAPFADGDILAVTAPDYDSQNTTLTVDASDPTVFTASAVTLTKETLGYLDNDKYTSYFLPDFEPGSDFTTTTSDTRAKFTGSMIFKLDSAKEVTFVVSCGSSDSSKTATFTLKDADENTIYTTGAMAGGAGSTTKALYLEAGTYTIVAEQTGSTNLQMSSVTVNPIAVFGITADQQTGSDSYYIAEEGGDAIVSDSTVYTGIAFDSGSADAADLVSGASYVVAYVVELTTGNSIDNLKIYFE